MKKKHLIIVMMLILVVGFMWVVEPLAIQAQLRSYENIVNSYLPRDYALLDNRNIAHTEIEKWLSNATDPAKAFDGSAWIVF